MLVLLSFALVLVATVLLVLGLLNDDNGMTLIYLSIASSVAAAIVLLVALKVSKPRQEVQRAAPEPLPEPEPEPALATVGAAATGAGASERGEWLASDQDHYAAEADADEDRWQAGADDGADEVEFPIADYDSLTAGQILPLLPQLYADEIPVVEERERATKARPEILDKLAELRAGFTAGSTVEAPPAAARDAEATPTPVDPLASYTEPAASTSAGWDDDADWFPIEDYESLSAAQIRPLLPELDEEELRMVRDKEAALGRRRSLLDEIDRLLGEPAPAASKPAPEPPAPAPAPAAATVPSEAGAPTAPTARAAAKQTTTAKAGTKRAAPKKTPAKKAAAKKATAAKAPPKKAATKKAPAKKAAAKKAPARKAATKKTPAKKAAAPKKASKATTSKKAPAKKSTKRSGGS